MADTHQTSHNSLVLILTPSNVGIPCQFSPARGQDGPGPEQPLNGFVHCPLQLKCFIRHADWMAWGESRLSARDMLATSGVFDAACGEGE